MSDALPLPPRPNLDQYRKLARDLQRAASQSEPDAFLRWASRWLETLARLRGSAAPPDASDPSAALAPELAGLERRWREFVQSKGHEGTLTLTGAQFFIARQHGFASWPAFVAHLDVSVTQLDITTAELNLCTISGDGRRVLVASQGNPVTIFDARTGARERALDSSTVNAWLANWTTNPRLVIAGSRDQSIDVWDIERGERVCVLRGHHGQPRAASTNAAVTRALTGCSYRDTTVKLWDLSTGACLRALDGHTDGVYAIAFHGDDRAASGSRDTTIRLWDLGAGRTTHVLTGHTYHVHSLAWSGDGRRLLSTSMDLRLWDTDTGQCLRVFEGHTEVIRSVVWSPDETYALTASHDRTARLWNVDTGQCERVFEGHQAGLVSASFSADGRRVFTCDWLGEIRSSSQS